MPKQFIEKGIASLERILTVGQREWISCVLGVIMPIVLIDPIASFLCTTCNVWPGAIAVLTIKLTLSGTVFCLAWNEIGRLRESATKDPLTKLLNRRGMSEKLLAETRAIQRELNGMTISFPPCMVISFDLDNFKLVNDTFGHAAGDKVLVIVAEIVQTVFKRREWSRRGELRRKQSRSEQSSRRKEDTPTRRGRSGVEYPGRLGGDEFLVVLFNITSEMALALAEEFRVAIANDGRLQFGRIAHIGSQAAPHITVSVGVAPLKILQTSSDEDIEAAFHNAIIAADTAIYLSKKNGRNSVSSGGSGSEPTRPAPLR